MILIEDFVTYLIQTESDAGTCDRVVHRLEMYRKLQPTAPQLPDGQTVIDGRYLLACNQGNYTLSRIEDTIASVVCICQCPSSVLIEVISDSLRITHRRASPEATAQEIQRLTAVCLGALNSIAE
ncbi:hypothetical protein NK105_000017 [Escherichia coli]|nr:hypothetical protein [Escherichia coli]EJK1789458.1 hypothetical protein [Escherichia coli]ELC8119433.1 hypothetical protein [Escherichia coli]HDH7177583.1 hypothetical protein [Escherichia coli]